MVETVVRLTLRLPESLYRRIRELAEREHRSIHGQLIHLLDMATVRGSDQG